MKEILTILESLPRKADGDVYNGDIVAIAKTIGTDHKLALKLWDMRDTAAQALAIYIVDPARTNEKFLDRWVRGINEWGICDSFTARLVRPQEFAVRKAHEWALRQPEFERRAGFSLMAQMAWQDNDHKDRVFIDFLPLVEKHAGDDRLYVKKAVNWALRDIGKRNPALRKHALAAAKRLQASGDKTARWVGAHRMREVEDSR